MNIATAAQMREMDRTAIEERGIPSVQLMEAAACAVARAVSELAGGKTDGRAVLFCGPGNNGGDGVAAARFLLEMVWEVRCVLVGKREKMSVGWSNPVESWKTLQSLTPSLRPGAWRPT